MGKYNLITRRNFLKAAGVAGFASALPWGNFIPRAYAAFPLSPALRKFVQPMRQFGAEIPLATPNTTRFPENPFPPFTKAFDYYEIHMDEFSDKLHPDLPPTTLWGYSTADREHKHLSGAIIAQKERPVRIKWTNNLPNSHILPVDPSVIPDYAEGAGLTANRAAVHLHGGLVPWPSDGGPFHWFSSIQSPYSSIRGPSVVDWLPDSSGQLTDDYWYPNDQTPRLLWYHDHAVGTTRLNAYAGLASGYILVDESEGILMEQLGILPATQIPIVIQDKVFNADGSLFYPDFYDLQFFALAPGGAPLPSPSLVPEFWGDTILVNGTAYPYLEVEPRRYRIRLLNACNTRFLSLRLLSAQGNRFPQNTEADPTAPNAGPVMRVIGTEGGFLDGSVAPQGVIYNNRKDPLVLGPAERADIIIDFSNVKTAGRSSPTCFILYNDAPVPFPGGTPLADFDPNNNKLPVQPTPGFSPNTRTLLQFRIVPLGTKITTAPPPVSATWALPPSPPPVQTVPQVRRLALWETVDPYGRLAQNLGDLNAALGLTDVPTEVVTGGSVETWEVFNLTADTHPIHFHYVNVRILSRQPFHIKGAGTPAFRGQPIPPEPHEQGWKETVRMNPGECTRLLVEIPAVTGLAPDGVVIPPSPRLAEYGDPAVAGAEYVWHCHILEHEEHDMMRPLVVQD